VWQQKCKEPYFVFIMFRRWWCVRLHQFYCCIFILKSSPFLKTNPWLLTSKVRNIKSRNWKKTSHIQTGNGNISKWLLFYGIEIKSYSDRKWKYVQTINILWHWAHNKEKTKKPKSKWLCILPLSCPSFLSKV
jgi:hypothetical protein